MIARLHGLISAVVVLLAGVSPLHAQSVKYKLSIDMEMGRNTAVTWTQRQEYMPLNASVLQSLTNHRFVIQANQTFDLAEAYTLKPDGRRVPIDSSQIAKQDGAMSGASTVNDVKVRQYAFREVSVGDTVVVVTKWAQSNHYFPGHFTWHQVIVPQARDVNVDFRLKAPKSLAISHGEKDFAFEETASGDQVSRRWSGTFPAAAISTEKDVAGRLASVPAFAFSTFENFEAIGKAYYASAAPKAKVTPAIQKLADSITSGKTAPKEQATAIFDWITQNVQYVAVYIGNGGLVPNDADTVLSRRTGDCKDHVVLMGALLAAKGIDSEPVLINTANEYELPRAPVLAFNHAIIYIPALDLYADPTARYSTLTSLPRADRGKPVVRASKSGATVARTPAGDADSNVLRLTNRMTFDADGRVNGETAIESTGEFAESMRAFVASAESTGAQTQLANVAKVRSISGTFAMTAPESRDHSDPYRVTASWKGDTAINIFERGWTPTPGLSPMVAGWSLLFGQFERAKRVEPILCRAGKIVTLTTVEMPDDVRLARLPRQVSIEGRFYRLQRTWTRAPGRFEIETTMVSSVEQRVCDPGIINEILASQEGVRFNPRLLFTKGPPGNRRNAPNDSRDDASGTNELNGGGSIRLEASGATN